MRSDSVKKLKGEEFRRLTGVQRSTFEEMAALLFAAKCKQTAALPDASPTSFAPKTRVLLILVESLGIPESAVI